MMIDLQAAIADYAASHELEWSYTMCPSVDSETNLPADGSEEGDVRKCKDTGNYYIYDNGNWNILLENTSIDADGIELATHEEVLAALKAGEVND